ncbi:hypothetical protein [Candidatus Finniella inopinata]|uniref:Uncharacterized protein n=1 Tax=Candidatus Finniella inopinata TaxID=1696036 RepID=A0A4Q7DKJ8_9PROT|nr:hypothetical protein [Candidatus Finniella inopinata]RZI46614.1 hypothetical protein EQU50_03235 [Candidatus Finniella inopinata]
MVFNKIMRLMLLMSTSVTCAYAGTSQATSVSGPSFLFNSSVTRPRAILHAFDVSLTTITRPPTFQCDPVFSTIYPNFNTADMSPILNYVYAPSTAVNPTQAINRAGARGYTHIQISPMQYIPSNSNIWSAAYQPYVMVLYDPNYSDQTTAPYAYYLTAVNTALTAMGKSTVTDLQRYGVAIPDTAKSSQTITVGYMLQSPLYGGLSDLTNFILTAAGNPPFGIKQSNLNPTPKTNIGVIADVVFDQANFAMVETPLPLPDNSQVVPAKLHPMKIDNSFPEGATQDKNRYFPAGFFTQDDLNKNSWQFGPKLDLSNPLVQKMAVGYLRLLYDLGVAGVRVDDLPIISAASIIALSGQDAQYIANQQSAAIWKSIFTQANTAYTYTPQGSSTSVTLPGFSFNCGYGEYFWSYSPQVSPFIPIMPLVDFIIQGSWQVHALLIRVTAVLAIF